MGQARFQFTLVVGAPLLPVTASRLRRRSNLLIAARSPRPFGPRDDAGSAVKGALVANLLFFATPLTAQPSLPTVRVGAPTVQMSGSAGPNDQTLLSGVIGATRLSNGTVVVGDGAFPRILLFSSLGQFQQALGRTGDGPGELRMPRWVGRCGRDQFGAYDAALLRLTLFSQSGTLHKTVSIPAAAGFNQVLACRADTLIFLLSQPERLDFDGGTTFTVNAALARVAATAVDTIASIPRAQEYYLSKARAGFSDVPLGRRVHAAAGPGRVFVCSNQDAVCTVSDMAGQQQKAFTIALERLKLSAGDWDHALRRRVEAEPRLQTQQVLAGVLKELRPPAHFPLIDQIHADSEDRLWVRTFRGYGSAQATWLIVGQDGKTLADAILPRNLQPLEIGPDYLLGLSRDTVGVETVGLYRVQLRQLRGQ